MSKELVRLYTYTMLALSGSLVLVVLLTGVLSQLIPDKVLQVDFTLCINMCQRSQTTENTHYCLCTTLDKNDTNVSLAENYRRKVVVKFEKWPTKDKMSCIETSRHFGSSRVQFVRGDIGICVLQASDHVIQAFSCGRVKASRKGIEMNCVSCRLMLANSTILEVDHYCQGVNGYTVCSFVKDGRACTCTTKTVNDNNCSLENTVSKLEDFCSKLTSPDKTIELPKDAAIQKGSIWIKYTPFCAMAWDTPTNTGISREKKKCHRPLNDLWTKDALRTRFFAGTESINCFEGEQKMTPVMFAAQLGKKKVVEQLLYAGVDLSAVSQDGWHGIHYAATRESSIVVRIFVKLGVDPELRTMSTGKTPLLLATERSLVLMIHYLLSIGCDLNAVSNRGQNILHLAVLNLPQVLHSFRKVKVKHLLNAKDIDGKTPVDLAKKTGKYYLKKYITM